MIGFAANAQVGIGTTTPNSNALLDLTSTNKALLISRVANTAAIASPVNGMIVYDLSSESFKSYQNSAWGSLGTATTPADLIYNTLSTSQASYNTAEANTWVQVTAAEYEAVATIAGAAKYGYPDTAMNGVPSAGEAGGNTVTTVPNAGTVLPGANYVIAMSFIPYASSTSNNGVKLKYAPSGTPTTGLADYPAYNSFTYNTTNYTSGVRAFFVLKKPSKVLPAGSFILGMYYQNGLSLGMVSATGRRRNGPGGDVYTGITASDTNGYPMQVIATSTKNW